jgi:hypothetical protein
MMKQKGARKLFTTVVVSLPFLLSAQTPPDLVVFDHGDPVGARGGYYDASVGIATLPSTLTTTGPTRDKLVVLTNEFYTGTQGGLLQWKSAPGGSWTFFIASPGFQTRKATAYSSILFYVNGPRAIAAANLPKVGLESSLNKRTPLVALGKYLPEGLDGDTNTWQKAFIPLADFQPYGGFSLAQFKNINFNQGSSDNVTNTMWLDGVRIVVPGLITNAPAPSPPARVVTRVGDGCIVLHWDRSDVRAAGYMVYRSSASNGVFTIITGSPIVAPSFADFAVTNDQTYFYYVRATSSSAQESADSATVHATPRRFADDNDFLEYVEQTSFDYFWYEANPTNGLVRDRSEPFSTASVAATGFGLTGIGIAVDHGWITRAEGLDRAVRALRTLWQNPQGTQASGKIGYRGWFYHFLDFESGLRSGASELSSIDTALLVSGVLYAKQYFSGTNANEVELRNLADAIVNRVDWRWMAQGSNALSLGWTPESGFLGSRWIGYNEAMVLYILALGASSNAVPASGWAAWTAGYSWQTNSGQSFVEFPPLFGHQYSQCWLDCRHLADGYMQGKISTYFENSRRATLAQRNYCIANPGGFEGYSSKVWGLTACDGPGAAGFYGYIARGAPPALNDDGTIAPTAAGGSLPFAPEVCLPTLRYFYDTYRTNIWTGYGFRDAFNLQADWWDSDVLGIDQGPILLMAENYRSEKVWRLFAQNPQVQRGLAAAGFVPLPFVLPYLSGNRTGGSFTLSWSGNAGRSYQVEYSPDLIFWRGSPVRYPVLTNAAAFVWVDLGPPVTASDPLSAPQRFYRAFQLGPP